MMYILHNYYGCISSRTAYNKYSMDTPVAPCIRLTNITKCFGIGDAEHYALDDVNLTVEQGEFIAKQQMVNISSTVIQWTISAQND